MFNDCADRQQQQHPQMKLQACCTTQLLRARLAAVVAPDPSVRLPQLLPALHLPCTQMFKLGMLALHTIFKQLY